MGMTGRGRGGWVAGAAGVVATVVWASPARGDVLYDTLWITNTLLTDAGIGNCIGGARVFPSLGTTDSQLADDFTIASAVTLTRVTVDCSTFDPGDMPDEGFRVQVYRDAQGVPDEALHAEYTATVYQSAFFGMLAGREGYRFEIDVSAAQITLEPGTWWMDVQPLDEAHGGWLWSSAKLDLDPPEGSPAHVRDGWLAHGTAAFGLWNSTTWKIHNFRGRGTPARKIEGDVVGSGCDPDLTTTAVPGAPGYGVANGVLNNDDFFYYLAIFAAGC